MARKAICKGFKGFSLTELLIALLILGQIATFSIPKILQSQNNARNKAVAKEAIGAISEAFQLYRIKNAVTTSTGPLDLTPYLNYVKIDTSSTMDFEYNDATVVNCATPNWMCLTMHNGGVLYFWEDDAFCNTTTLNAVAFWYDPDGKNSGSATGQAMALPIWLYANGKVRTKGTAETNTAWGLKSSGACTQTISANTAADPPWFSWN